MAHRTPMIHTLSTRVTETTHPIVPLQRNTPLECDTLSDLNSLTHFLSISFSFSLSLSHTMTQACGKERRQWRSVAVTPGENERTIHSKHFWPPPKAGINLRPWKDSGFGESEHVERCRVCRHCESAELTTTLEIEYNRRTFPHSTCSSHNNIAQLRTSVSLSTNGQEAM